MNLQRSISKGTILNIEIIDKNINSSFGSELIDYNDKIELDEYFYVPISKSVKGVVNNAGAAASSSIFTSIGISMMSNPASAWILINTIQLISYLPISSSYLTSNIKDFCKGLAGFNLLPNPISYIFDEASSEPPTKTQQEVGIDSSVFWVNSGQNASVLIIMILLSPFFIFLSKLPYTSLSSRFSKILKNYRYGMFLRYWIQAYLDLGFFALIQLHSSIVEPAQGNFNLASATIVMVSSI